MIHFHNVPAQSDILMHGIIHGHHAKAAGKQSNLGLNNILEIGLFDQKPVLFMQFWIS